MGQGPVRRIVGYALAGLLAVTTRAESQAAPVTASRPQEIAADTMLFAEGIAADTASGTLYVTSVHRRNVLVVAPSGATRWLWREGSASGGAGAVGSVMGAVFDGASGTLWLSTAKLPYMRSHGADDARVVAELLEVSARDGSILRRFALGDGGGTPGEIALAPDGSVLVSDGLRSQLYRLRPGAAVLETIRSAALRSPQGIAVRPDGAVAYVADWSRGILRWDLATDSILPVMTDDGRLLRGVDGLRWHEGALLAMQNGASPNRVLRVTLDAEGAALAALTVLDAPDPLEGELTVGVVLGDEFVYVASSAWPFWTEEGQRKADGRPLPPAVLRRLRLR